MRVLLIAVPLSWVLVYWFGSPVEWVWGAILLGSVVTALVSVVWLRVGLARAERGALPGGATPDATDPRTAAAQVG